MHFYPKLTLPLFLLLLFWSCSTSQPTSSLRHEARQTYQQNQYELALEKLERIIQQDREARLEPDGEIYNMAGIAAFQLGEKAKALQYLDQARHTSHTTEQTFYILARLYREQDNLSREITNLEAYLRDYPQEKHAPALRVRYFEAMVESQSWLQAQDTWPLLPDSIHSQEHYLGLWFTTNRQNQQESQCDQIATELLKINRNNTEALDWLARKHYHLAENRYQKEMQAYQQNRTQRQYAQLLKAFEVLNQDFRISLDYFLRLYRINPRPEYAGLIGNIYMRFEDKEKADYYHRIYRRAQ